MDITSFNKLYNDNVKWMVFVARNVVGDFYAEDMVANVFVKAYNAGNVTRSWLNIVLRSECFNLIKHERIVSNYAKHSLDETNDFIDAQFVKAEVIDAVSKSIEELPLMQKKVFKLYWFDELSSEDIAKMLCININSVRTHLMRARQTIKSVIR